MGVAFSAARRKVMRFNVEERAFKVLDAEKPKPAPHHPLPSKLEHLARPEVDLSRLHEKDPALHDRLRPVFVTSSLPVERAPQNPDRPLPQNRAQPEAFEYGLKEPDVVPAGRLTVRRALEMLGRHADDPAAWNAEKLASEYNLNAKLTGDVLKNFRLFEVKRREEPGPKKGVRAPSTLTLAQPFIYQRQKELPPGDVKSEKAEKV